MWQPTHLQVTVQRAKNLNYKGKNETNDAFVVIALGKDKFQTSIKEKASSSVEWHEECELAIPSHGNTASLNLTVYHRNALGLDEFLGQVQLPLSEFDAYERPRNRWHRLKGKPEKDRKKGEKERGELETKVAFIVKSGSLLDVSKKEKNKSITSLKHLGGSLMSLGNKEKANLKSFAKSVSHKIDKIAHKPGKKKSRKESRDSQGFPQELMQSRQHAGDADPGVISDSDDDFGFDEEVTVNTRSSSPYSTLSRGSSLLQDVHEDDGVRVNGNNHIISDSRAPPKPVRLGGNVVEVPSIALASPTPSPEPFPRNPPVEPTTPVTLSSNPPLTFPNLTPINLITHSDAQSSRDSASSDSAMTLSLSSSVIAKDTNSLASLESFSPEPAPLTKEDFQEPVTIQDPPSPEPSPIQKEIFPETFIVEDPPVPVKPLRYSRSNSASETSVPSPASTVSDQSLLVPSPKSRSLSTSAAPKIFDRTVFSSSPIKESNTKRGFALEALASASTKVSLMETDSVIQTPGTPTSKKNTELTLPASKTPSSYNGIDVSTPPTPTTPSASTYSFGSGSAMSSAPTTPKDGSSGPSPALTSRSSRGTPGLAERPTAAVVRSGSLHEKPTTQPVIDEWERKLYGRNAIVGSMENVNRSDSRSSLSTSLSSSTQDVTRLDEHGSRFPEIKAIRLEKKSREEGDDGEGKKRRGKGGGLKAKLFGSSRERIGEEDGRIVEGGNDRLPHPPTHQSRLPREIHDKFAGKSREDLMEMIVNLQSCMEKNVRHTRDLEDYIDGLLLRVMETTPQLLQAPVTKNKKIKVQIFGLH
ncbi:rab11 family-interacting protein 1-like [Homarus americanus]|uniref:rab11 family-interacting protein 1-like n=1 Tax=Homarus americanus TaxID=6706 RepID=UPI001C46648F|nr:rab11 family-interacting protein 1-like [Homarus americanus]